METMEIEHNGFTTDITNATSVEYDSEKVWVNPINEVIVEYVIIRFDMAMPFVPLDEYVLVLDNLVWGVQCISETITHSVKGVHAEYKFKRLTYGT